MIQIVDVVRHIGGSMTVTIELEKSDTQNLALRQLEEMFKQPVEIVDEDSKGNK
tara:strand:+ start:266 stop:427 length:162 start_codon:yes stop_codon:yes gene_type:complete